MMLRFWELIRIIDLSILIGIVFMLKLFYCYLYFFVLFLFLVVRLDKCNVKGFNIKSLIDDVDYIGSIKYKYGIYKVDFNDLLRFWIRKFLVNFIINIIKDNGFL